ncbi:hypothetical protein M9H61_12625 [Thalassospira sp. GO-4]|uniref:hypothetical protein n=1 Tax=Thalassospira sp. GO-4 TaxID=2946605 RepID=UPI00202440E5|nr:hypothetical protein [Thalassospira sp. GO-4]URK16391.1 hypothetical protein M9H61_12625 [Thalassospira sp. GO-4]
MIPKIWQEISAHGNRGAQQFVALGKPDLNIVHSAASASHMQHFRNQRPELFGQQTRKEFTCKILWTAPQNAVRRAGGKYNPKIAIQFQKKIAPHKGQSRKTVAFLP